MHRRLSYVFEESSGVLVWLWLVGSACVTVSMRCHVLVYSLVLGMAVLYYSASEVCAPS